MFYMYRYNYVNAQKTVWKKYSRLITVVTSEGKTRSRGRIFQLIFIVWIFYWKKRCTSGGRRRGRGEGGGSKAAKSRALSRQKVSCSMLLFVKSKRNWEVCLYSKRKWKKDLVSWIVFIIAAKFVIGEVVQWI